MEHNVTINTVAELAGTSKTTVSFYLNGKFDKLSAATRKRIEKAIEDTNFHPNLAARSLSRNRTKLVGVILGDLTNNFSNEIIKGIETVTIAEKYQIVFGNSGYDPSIEKQYIEQMLNMGVDGLIIQPTERFADTGKKLETLGVPVVFFDSEVPSPHACRVKTGTDSATLEAAEKCMKMGYEDFLMITADPEVLSTRRERADSFQKALRKYDKPCKIKVIGPQTNPEELTGCIEENIRLNRRSLIFVPTCWALSTVYLALKKYHQLIPQNIGLLGFDNTEWTRLATPSITTIVQPVFEEGRQAMKLLIDLLEGCEKPPVSRVLNCTVNWCESTAPQEREKNVGSSGTGLNNTKKQEEPL